MEQLKALANANHADWRMINGEPTVGPKRWIGGSISDWLWGVTSPKRILPTVSQKVNLIDYVQFSDVKDLTSLRDRVKSLHSFYNTQVTFVGSFLGGWGDIKNNSECLVNVINERLFCLFANIQFNPNDLHIDQHPLVDRIYTMLTNPNPSRKDIQDLEDLLTDELNYNEALDAFYKAFADLDYPAAQLCYAERLQLQGQRELQDSQQNLFNVGVYVPSVLKHLPHQYGQALAYYAQAANAGSSIARTILEDLYVDDVLGLFGLNPESQYQYADQFSAWSDKFSEKKAYHLIFGPGVEQDLPQAYAVATGLVAKHQNNKAKAVFAERLSTLSEVLQKPASEITMDTIRSYMECLEVLFPDENNFIQANEKLALGGSVLASYAKYKLSGHEPSLEEAANSGMAFACYDFARIEELNRHFTEAYAWAQKAFGLGHERGHLIMAELILKAHHFPDDNHADWTNHALEWFQQLIDSPNKETRTLAEASLAQLGHGAIDRQISDVSQLVQHSCQLENHDDPQAIVKNRCMIGYMFEQGIVVALDEAQAANYHADMAAVFENQGIKYEKYKDFNAALWLYKQAAEKGSEHSALRASKIIGLELVEDADPKKALDLLEQTHLMHGYGQRAELALRANNDVHTEESLKDLAQAAKSGHYLSILRVLAHRKTTGTQLKEITAEEYSQWRMLPMYFWDRLKDRNQNITLDRQTPLASYEGLEELLAASSLWSTPYFREPLQELIDAYVNYDANSQTYGNFPDRDRQMDRLKMIKRLIDTAPKPEEAYKLATQAIFGDTELTDSQHDALNLLLQKAADTLIS